MKLNEWQQAVVDTGAKGPIVVEACPGSGKTRTLEETVAALINAGANPLKVGVFTFTRKASAEARRRVGQTLFPDATEAELAYYEEPFDNGEELQKEVGNLDLWAAEDPRREFVVKQISTIHALSYRTLKALGYDLNVLGGKLQWEADAIVKDGLKELDWEESPKAVKLWFSHAINNLVTPAEAREWYAGQLERMGGPVWVAPNLAELFKRYMDFCKRHKVVDFDMMQARLLHLLRTSAEARTRCQEMYDYILVDEAQDTNPIQSEIIFCMAKRTGNLLYCGDVDQSVYAFRGAQPSILREDFEAEWPQVRRFNLPINYRSTGTIVGTTAGLIGDNYQDDTYLKPFQTRPDAPDGEAVTYTEEEKFDALADEVANAVKEQPGDWFVLNRTRAECAALHTHLISLEIPAINKSGGLLFGAPHVRKVLAYARLACDYHGARDDLEVLYEIANVASAEFRAPMTRRRHLDGCSNPPPWKPCGCPIVMEEGLDFSHARFYGRKAIDSARGWSGIIRQMGETNRGGYPTLQSKGASDLVQFVEKVERHKDDARAALNAIIEGCVLPWLKAEEGLADEDLAENGKAEDFSLLVNLTEPDESLESYLDRVEELSRGGIEGNDEDSVLLGTIHWSKGAERPKVAVNTTRLPIIPPEAKAGQLPTGRPPSMEEERRLLFVAMTRAKDECHLFGSLEWNGNGMERSEFVQAMIDRGLVKFEDEEPIPSDEAMGNFFEQASEEWHPESETTKDDDFNDRWLEHKAEFARCEAEQEQAAFLSDPDYRRAQDELAADVLNDPERRARQETKDLALCAEFGRSDLLSRFPHPGRFEGNIYRPSARELAGALPNWTPTVNEGQLVLTKELAPGHTALCYTSIKVGQIAGSTGEDSIRVTRRDESSDGRIFWYKNKQDWVTRSVPADADTPEKAAAHLASKIEKQVRHQVKDKDGNLVEKGFTRPCPECGALQVKCRDRARKSGFWWKGTACRCKTEGGW